ncbi:SH3 domain protein [Trypanosoma rangeli]|uniref:SH3 domain protein n=1 Tax=Trypanosoma rangeli TaxID=5698 RepID=A0A422NCY3_TRYRA|nr:SH3 domain protein [Trypanosoma rangeli]RNF03331.1 SH3 domain protein [Trypanosoma rangeli]|eukprot:RNF03331.1 SH3 domain protein [Trypanosoma rangeli]
MSPMYGGYGGGMSSMYGGYGGGMSSMYGGGLGTMGGLTGGMSGGMFNGGMPDGMNGLSTLPNTQGTNNSILPPQSDPPQTYVSSKPAIEEGPHERRARRRKERKEEKEALEKHRQQKRQLVIHSAIQITGHVLQTLIQILRSGLELFGVGFGTYYSIKALKALVQSQEDSVLRKVTKDKFASATKETVNGDSAPGTSKLKGQLLISALFILMEVLYSLQQRYRGARERRTTRREDLGMLGNKDEESLEESLSQSEELSDDEASSEYSTDFTESLLGGIHNKSGKGKRVFVAVFDYEAPDREGFIGFKAGDRFVIEEYADSEWCEAFQMDASERPVRVGLVPGNFLRPLEGETKL